ncbi:MAG TPA: hypothetical protein VM118_03155 [Acidobacteriota bacterium]|nr:hypothetical protein [Acidobacteriota bacterium]
MAEAENTRDEDEDIVTTVHRNFKAARDHSSEWREHARDSFDMDAGRQWDEDTIAEMAEQNRVPVTFNRISRVISAIVGTQIQNRQETRYIPRELGDIKESEQYTAAGEYIRDNCDAEDEETDAFADCLICGMGWTETRLETEVNPDGDVLIERIDPLWMYWDPHARRKNIDDRRWQILVRRVPVEEFNRRWPDADVQSASELWDVDDTDEDEMGSVRRHVYPQDAYNARKSATHGQKDFTIRVAHYQWYELEDCYRIGPKAEPFDPAQFRKMKENLDRNGIKWVKQQRRQYKQAFIAGNQLLGEIEDCPVNGYTFNCLTGRRDRNKNTWTGIVDAMKDPQKFGNKFFSQILDIINKNAKGGVIIERTAVDDPREIEDKWARPDAVHWVKDGAISGNKIQPKPLPQYPQGLDRLMTFSLDNVMESAGMSQEMLGLSQATQQAGVVEYQRRQQGLVVLAPYFDALRLYRKVQGRVLLDFIRAFLSDGRLIRIMGEDGREEYKPLNRGADATSYDIIVDEAPTSPNQKEKVSAILNTMLPNLTAVGFPVPKEILDYSPMPSKLAQKWKEEIDKKAQGGLPPEVELQMAETNKTVQKLMEDNRQLKDKREQFMAEMQMKQQTSQMEGQMKMEQSQMEAEAKRQQGMIDIDAKREQMQADLAMAQQKFHEEIELARQKAGAELELSNEKMQNEFAIAMAKLEIDRKQKLGDEAGNSTLIDQAIEMGVKSVLDRPKPRRRVSVNRDTEGLIVDATIEDLDDMDPTEMAQG